MRASLELHLIGVFVLFQAEWKSRRVSQKPHLSSMQSEGQSGSSPLQSREKSRQQPRAPFPLPFIIPSSCLVKVFTMLGKISVCSLLMHIRRLLMAIRRLCTAIRSLQTEIAARCVGDSSTLQRPFQHMASRRGSQSVMGEGQLSRPQLYCRLRKERRMRCLGANLSL